MKAAIYARYSSENQREASIEDQSRNCERGCAQHGLEVTHRFADEAMSGAKTDRPGYQAVLASARRGEFDVIVVDEVSRLWRDQEEQWRAVKLLEFLGLHILGVSDGIDTRAGGYRLLLSIRGAMNEEARREVAWRTHRGQEGQARKGYSAGGRLYGYRNVPEYHPSEKDHLGRAVVVAVRRAVDPEQANWVLWIFGRYAEGWSPRRIADELNQQGVPSPGSTWARKEVRRCRGWAASSIYGDQKKGSGILFNPLYCGKYIWNRTKRVINPDTKGRQHKLREESEWVTQEIPELRIVPEDLWQRVQARRRRQGAASAKIRAALGRQARTGRSPRYLLSGFLRCGVCGGSYIMVNERYYGCATHKDRGSSVCPNGIKVRREVAEQKLLEGIRQQLLAPEVLELVRREFARAAAEGRREGQDKTAKRRLVQVETEIVNIVSAVRSGAYSPALQAELARLEVERERLGEQLNRPGEVIAALDKLPEAIEEYRAAVEELEVFAREENDVETARELLRPLLGGEVPLRPTSDGHLYAKLPPGALLRALGAETVVVKSGTEERT